MRASPLTLSRDFERNDLDTNRLTRIAFFLTLVNENASNSRLGKKLGEGNTASQKKVSGGPSRLFTEPRLDFLDVPRDRLIIQFAI